MSHRVALAIVCVFVSATSGCGTSHRSASYPSTGGDAVTVIGGVGTFQSGCAKVEIVYPGQRRTFRPSSQCPEQFDCHSHNADAIAAAPLASSAGRAMKTAWKRGKNGHAVLSLTTASDGHVTATCR